MKAILDYLDLAAVFVLFIVAIFLEPSFMAKLGIVIAMGLFLSWTAWKRHKGENLNTKE